MNNEKIRKYKRHKISEDIQDNVFYNVKTKMEFHIDSYGGIEKYTAYTKNLSVEGLCFISDKKLDKGIPVHLSLFLPKFNEEVCMDGQVKWSKSFSRVDKNYLDIKSDDVFETGMRILMVNGCPVFESIHYDELFHLQWSALLESVFGKYRLLMDKRSNELN